MAKELLTKERVTEDLNVELARVRKSLLQYGNYPA
jgi:hypothetical protein